MLGTGTFSRIFLIALYDLMWVGEVVSTNNSQHSRARFLPEYANSSISINTKLQSDIGFFGQLVSKRGITENLILGPERKTLDTSDL